MLISNRRIRLIFTVLTGMEAAVITPWLLLLFSANFLDVESLPTLKPMTLFLALWSGLLGMIVVMDILSHSSLSDTSYRLVVVGLIALTALLSAWLLVERGSLFGLHWLGRTVDGLINFHRGLRPTTIIFLLTIFLWLRGTALSSREINFKDVGLSFRLGLLLLLLSGGFMALRLPSGPTIAVTVVGLFLALGLLAVSLARTDDKATAASDTRGGSLPWSRSMELLLMVGMTVGIGLLVAALYTPERMLATLHFFDPIWSLLGSLLRLIVYVFALVAEAVVRFLFDLIGPLLANMELVSTWGELGERNEIEEESQTPQEWQYAGLVGLLVRVVGVSVFVLGLLWLAYLFLERRRHRSDQDSGEESAPAPYQRAATGLLPLYGERLKNLVGAMRRYGFGSKLLAAISVENMYANLTRLARTRGHPRDPSRPPDVYLPKLRLAFPGHDEALARITEAYMQVHYGDEPLAAHELAVLRSDYQVVLQQSSDIEISS